MNDSTPEDSTLMMFRGSEQTTCTKTLRKIEHY